MTDPEFVEILLVEDSGADAEMTIRSLKRRGLANQLVWVKDGAEALDFIYCTGAFAGRRNGHPRLVLLDIKMPKVDGIEVLRRIKSDERTRSIPVVILTSSAEERDIIESYQLGVNSYLVKPVEFSAFTEVVAQLGMYWAVLNRLPGYTDRDMRG
ncbi:MAG: response regulator [Betaproteobacteria bacterium]|nr:response regulator [Betaproteobacteria bacterium]MDE2210187.1 response regulator [Betaproteobacteria bacterium]MDE2360064.1 response regulator [Betaproteobacteria bacterium]